MSTSTEKQAQPVYLKDYEKPHFSIPTTRLKFELDPQKTKVSSKLEVKRETQDKKAPLILNGENIELISIRVDGKSLNNQDYELSKNKLLIKSVPDHFSLEIENFTNPQANTELDGLYLSSGIFCTQNEPEGFRKICYYLDRPDAMSTFTTTIVGPAKSLPIMLSNGNKIASRQLENGLHEVTWEDPFLKPCYLFALVAGDLGMIEDSFITKSGRKIQLEIYCDKGNEKRCTHAMESLKKSMKWDEQVFGLEYDLDIYMIVAVDSFNMGAMENKGLNIFNTSCTLAQADSATDYDFQRVEQVIAHEYFHNWTGNRVTCRDWFQLTLKEGLTVFRDQEFSSDMNSRAVKRIEDVDLMRTHQFPEDSGPTSHPIQPQSYLQINNFYTVTIYDKGAEIIRMIHTLLGADGFRKGMDKYFELYDGMAVTTEDFVSAMEQGSNKDLKQFRNWYPQKGTPRLEIFSKHNPETKTFSLHVKQIIGKDDQAYYFPFKVALYNPETGKAYKTSQQDSHEHTLIVNQKEQVFEFDHIADMPHLSLNRNFSAPVIVESKETKNDLLFLLQYDDDPFIIWDAQQRLVTHFVQEKIRKPNQSVASEYFDALKRVLKREDLDEAFKAKFLCLPQISLILEQQTPMLIDETYAAYQSLELEIAQKLQGVLEEIYHRYPLNETYAIDAKSIGRRALRNVSLRYLCTLNKNQSSPLAFDQFNLANNMTDCYQALSLMFSFNLKEQKQASQSFYQKWHKETLVMQKWLAAQSAVTDFHTLERVKTLMKDPVFDIKVPNLVRSLIGTFAKNSLCFNQKTGEGYAFLGEQIKHLDTLNPQVASLFAKNFNRFAKLDEDRQKIVKKVLKDILNQKLSNNTYEIISKCLTAV